MAQLPGLALNPSQGEAPSAASVAPYDLGLTQAAQNLQPFAEAAQKADARAVQPKIEELAAQSDRELVQQGEMYDGTSPGFAKQQISSFEQKAQAALAADPSMPLGQRMAMRRAVDELRRGFGQKAISVETQKAGHLVAEQQAAADGHVVEQALGQYNASFGAASGHMKATGGYASPSYVANQLAAHDQAAQAQLDSVPEALRPDLQRKLDAQRNLVQAQAMADQSLGLRVAAASSAAQTSALVANGVLSDPSRVTAALASTPDFAGLLPEERVKAQANFRSDIAAARINGLVAKDQIATAQAELTKGTWDAYITPETKTALLKSVRETAAQKARDALESFHWGGSPDLAQAKANALAAGDEGLAAQAQWRIDVGALEPGALKELQTGGGTGFGRAFAFTVDGLEGGATLVQNDNGKGPSKFGVNAAAHPGVDIPNLTRPLAEAIAKKYWVAIGADNLPPDLASAAFATAYNTGIGPVKAMLAQAGNDTGKFLGLAEQRYRAIAASDPSQAKNLPIWLDRLAKVRTEAARQAAFVNVASEVSSDPIKYAMGDAKRGPLAQVPALPGDPADPAWAQALQGRLSVGQMMNGRYHAPLRLLTDGDAQYYKAAIERDPNVGLALAQHALPVVGPANTRALLAEVGLHGGSAQLHVADLAAMGLTTFPQAAAKGLALGDKLKADPMKLKALNATFDGAAALFNGQPDARVAIQGAAEAALRADASGGVVRTPDWYLDSALGGSTRNGKAYGGLARVNGAQTILPPWLAKDRAADVLHSLGAGFAATGKGPVWSNGHPATAREIAGLRLQMQPNGRYRMLDSSGNAMLAKGGAVFELNLDAEAKTLRTVYGKAGVLEGW